MKKYISLLLFSISTFFFTQNTLANMWPASASIWAGGIEFQTGSILQENISVEKHFLLFQTSGENIYDEKAPYSWYDFLEKITNIPAKTIEKNSFQFYISP